VVRMDERRIIIYEKPKLNKPYLLIGFEGWPDAGKVSSGAVSYLRDRLGVRELAEVAPDDFYLFQSPSDEIKRPVVDIQDGLVTGLSLPATKLWFYKNQGAGHDLIIMLGREPELRWNDYVNLILDLAQNFGVVRAYAIGGTYDVVPHTLAPMVVAVQGASGLEAEMKEHGIQTINYRGPSSIHTLFLVSAGLRKLEMVSLWGYVPHYVQVPNTKVCHGILSKLTRMLELDLKLEDIKGEGEQLDEMVDNALAQKPELSDYVKRLELEYGKAKDELGEPIKEDIIKDIEDFLKHRGEG